MQVMPQNLQLTMSPALFKHPTKIFKPNLKNHRQTELKSTDI